jgi:hypothetical protein
MIQIWDGFVMIARGGKMNEEDYRFRCHDEDCDCYGKRLVWIPKEDGGLRMICPVKILTQSDYNLKYVRYESEAQKDEA